MKMIVLEQGDLYRQGSSLGESELTRDLAGVDYPDCQLWAGRLISDPGHHPPLFSRLPRLKDLPG
jgi:hypothetical protein